jgi:Tfp pilus assembly protein PilO
MKLEMKSSNAVILAMLVAAALAGGFWMLILSPKRDEASKLDAKVTKLKADLAQHEGEAEEAEEARKGFPTNYQQLVVLGKAVPGDDDTPSLLVQLNQISDRVGVTFQTLTLEAEKGAAEAASTPQATTEPGAGATPASLVSPTEVAASTLPLGASIGSAGLGVMPYSLTFIGKFFQMADFIKGLDSLVKTENENVDVTGRLITIDSFSLKPEKQDGFPVLEAEFFVTTYLTPPEEQESVTAGASPTAPAPAEATPASTTTGGAP